MPASDPAARARNSDVGSPRRPVGARATNPSEHRLARVKIRRHKHWGWGYEDQQPAPAELRQTAAVLAEHLRVPLGEIESPVASRAGSAGAGARAAPPCARGHLRERRSRARVARAGQVLRRRRRRLPRTLRAPTRLRRPPALGGRRRAAARVVRRRARRGDPVRWRHVRGRRSHSRRLRATTTERSRSTCARSIACSRSTTCRARRASRRARRAPASSASWPSAG